MVVVKHFAVHFECLVGSSWSAFQKYVNFVKGRLSCKPDMLTDKAFKSVHQELNWIEVRQSLREWNKVPEQAPGASRSHAWCSSQSTATVQQVNNENLAYDRPLALQNSIPCFLLMKFLKDCYGFYGLKLIQLLTFQWENETNFYETVLEMQGFFLSISGLHRLVIRNIFARRV